MNCELKPCTSRNRSETMIMPPLIAKRWRHILLIAVATLSFSSAAFARGGDYITNFPLTDPLSAKQEAKAMAVDNDGNIIVVGYTNVSGANNDYQVTKFNADGSGVAWRATFDKAGGDDQATAVVVDSGNNVIVTGTVWNGSNSDIHTIKYGAGGGTPLWQHTWSGAAGADISTSIAIDGSNNIYVAGYSINSSGNDDYLIIKYPAAGAAPDWVEIFDSSYSSNDRIAAIAAGTDGIAVTGASSKGGTDFDILTRKYGFDKSLVWEQRKASSGGGDDRGVAVRMDPSGGAIVSGYLFNGANNDIYTAKYAAASPGTPVWEQAYAGNGNDEPRALWVDGTDDVYLTGYSYTYSGNEDIYTVRYKGADGIRLWEAIYNSGSDYTDIPLGIVGRGGADGGLYVVGYTTTSSNENITTLKYQKASGDLVWQKSYNGPANKNERPAGIALDSNGEVCVAGWSDTAANSFDFLTIKYDFGRVDSPTGLTAAATSNTAIDLSWRDNSSNESGFKIFRKIGLNSSYGTDPISTTAAGVTTFSDSGLESNSYYYYQVRAANTTYGDSDNSNEAHALTKVVSYSAPGWLYTYNGGKQDETVGIVTGSDDHPLVTGFSELEEEGVPGEYSFDFMTIKLDRGDHSLKWKVRYDSGDGGTDMAAGLVLDYDGNAIVTGTAYLMGSGDKSDDLYTIKYNSAGHTDPVTEPLRAWGRQYGTEAGIDQATAIQAVKDASSSVIVIGHGINVANDEDMFILKYNADGAAPWLPIVFDGGTAGNDYPSAVAVDASGNIFITGSTENAGGDFDIYTAKYGGSTGALIWAQIFAGAGSGDDHGLSLTVDKKGDVYMTGYSRNAAGNDEGVTIKYDGADSSTNREIWKKVHNGAAAPVNGNDRGIAIAIDPVDGAVVVAGTSYLTATDSDFHLIRYSPADGSIIWERNFDRHDSYEYVTAMAVDSSGYIYVTGNTRSGPDTDSASDASSDILSVIYSFEGAFLGATTYNGGLEDEARAIAVNYQGEAFTAGVSRNASNPDYLVLKQKNNYILVPAPLTLIPQADSTRMNITWQENTPDTQFSLERTPAPVLPDSVWSPVTVADYGITSFVDTGLSSGSSYCYRIFAFTVEPSLNSRYTSNCGTTTLVATALNPLVVDSTSQITLNWSQVEGNTGYKIERKTGAGGIWSDLIIKSADVTTHSDAGLTPGTIYYYRVSTGSSAGYSLSSNEQFTPTRPLAPTLNAPTSITNTQMLLGWNSVTGAASYTLQYKVSGGSYADFPGCTATGATTCTVTGLTAPNVYYFQVKAANTGGDSVWSNETSATAALAVPTLTAPTTITSTTMYLAWTNPVIPGANVTSYTLEYKEGSGGTYGPSGCPINTNLNCTVTGLTPNRTYYFHVKATNAAGSSNWSSEQNGRTLLTTPALTNVTGGAAQVSLTWTAVSDADGYTIQQADCKNNDSDPTSCNGTTDANYNSWTNKATNQPGPTYLATSLNAGTNYRYRILATTLAGNSSTASSILSAWTNIAKPSLTLTPISSTAIMQSWLQQPGETSYSIETGPTIDGPWTTLVAEHPMNNLSNTHTGLSLQTQYCYRIKANSSVLNPPPAVYSDPKCMTTPPVEPTKDVPTIVSSTQINLSWSQVATNTGYEIERCITTDNNQPVTHPLGTCTNLTPTVAQDVTTFSNTGLTAGYTYRYRVRALYNASANYTAWSNEYWVTTTLPTPTLVTPSVASTTTTQLTPTWNNVSGDNGYKLYWKLRSGLSCTDDSWSGPFTPTINATSYNHSGLIPGTFYCYKIAATGPSGPPATPDSVFSNIVTQSTKPSTTGTITFSGITTASITLSWPQVTGNSGYKIDRSPDNVTWSSGVGNVGTDITSFTNSGLTAGTLYYYRVSANSSGGYSANSAVQSTTTTSLAPVVTQSIVSAEQINISWPVVPGATNYKIERKVSGGSYSEVVNLAVSYAQNYCGEPYPTVACPSLSPVTTAFQNTSLTENTTYCFKIRSWHTSGGDSTYSTEKCATTLPIADETLTATPVNSFKIRLDWVQRVCTPNPCDPPEGYEIERMVREGVWVKIATVGAGVTTFTDRRAIDPIKQYRYRIRSYSGLFRSPYSSEAVAYTPPYTAGDNVAP